MPIVEVKILEGRTTGQKKLLAQALSDAVVNVLHVHREHVTVIVEEFSPKQWMRGGQLLSEEPLAPGSDD